MMSRIYKNRLLNGFAILFLKHYISRSLFGDVGFIFVVKKALLEM